MLLTFKVKHDRNLSDELGKAKKIAEFAIKTRSLSSKDVKQFGLKSMIANQVLRKYSRNKKCKTVKNVNLAVPSQGVKFDRDKKTIYIHCLKLTLDTRSFHHEVNKVNYIELDATYAYITCDVAEAPLVENKASIGVDMNSTGFILVAANPKTGKVLKLGKETNHIRKKYKSIRKLMQKRGRYKAVKRLKNKEARKCRDINHKISKKVVTWARDNNCDINLENLKKIRKNTGGKKALSHNLNSWAFYQLRQMIEYKAKLLGVTIRLIDPHNTSKTCSKSGLLGERDGKIFKSPLYGVEDADVNAAFNIALATNSDLRLAKERDFAKRHLTCRKKQRQQSLVTSEPAMF